MPLIAAFDIECADCSAVYETVYPDIGGIGYEDAPDTLTTVFDELVKSESGVGSKCPECGFVNSEDQVKSHFYRADLNDDQSIICRLIGFCDVCNDVVGWTDELCEDCGRLGKVNAESLLDDRERCPICDQLRFPNYIDTHHISYIPEETMEVCSKCHNQIHSYEDFKPELTPDMSRKEWKKQK